MSTHGQSHRRHRAKSTDRSLPADKDNNYQRSPRRPVFGAKQNFLDMASSEKGRCSSPLVDSDDNCGGGPIPRPFRALPKSSFEEERETQTCITPVEMAVTSAKEQDVKDECLPSKEDELEMELDDGHSNSKKLTKEEIAEKVQALFKPKDGFMDIIGNGQLKKKVVKPGTPDTRPNDGEMIRAKVKICLKNGTCVHDATETFFMGQGDVILAVDMCVAMMNEGEVSTVKAAPRFGYGSSGREPDIPPDADLILEIEMLEVLPPPEISTMSPEELFAFGEKKRVRGNECFSRGEYSGAIGTYLGALKFFEPENRELKGDQTLLAEIEDRRLKTYNNMAASQLKIGAADAAVFSCKQVIGRQPENVKALYRLGKAYSARGEMDKAINYLKEALKLEPESKLLHRELSAWTQKMRQEIESEKKMYRKMMGSAADVPVSRDKRMSSGSNMMKYSLIIGAIMVAMCSVSFAFYRSTH